MSDQHLRDELMTMLVAVCTKPLDDNTLFSITWWFCFVHGMRFALFSSVENPYAWLTIFFVIGQSTVFLS